MAYDTGPIQGVLDRHLNKPTYGVDYMNYRQRRLRLPLTALEHLEMAIPSPNSTIDGEPARRQAAAAGLTSGIVITLSPAVVVHPYIAFDYYAEDANFDRLRVDIRTDASNYFRFHVSAKDGVIRQGHNNLIFARKDIVFTSGAPSWSNISSIVIQARAGAVAHTFRVGNVDTYKFKAAVTVWFDDGHNTVYTSAKPTMDAHGFKGVQAIVGKWMLEQTNAVMTTAHLAEMQAAGWEHCNHTYSHLKFGEVTAAQAEISLQRGLDYSLAHNFGKAGHYLVNPGGQTTAETLPIEKRYATLRRIGIGFNYMPLVDTFNIKTFEPKWADPSATVEGWINNAITSGLWVTLLFHQIRPDGYVGDIRCAYPQTQFDAIMAYLDGEQAAGDLRVVTCSEALSLL